MATPITDTTIRGKCIFCLDFGTRVIRSNCWFFFLFMERIPWIYFLKHFKDSYKIISRSMPRLPLEAQSVGQNHSCFLVPFIEPRGENPLVFSFSDSHRFCYSFQLRYPSLVFFHFELFFHFFFFPPPNLFSYSLPFLLKLKLLLYKYTTRISCNKFIRNT